MSSPQQASKTQSHPGVHVGAVAIGRNEGERLRACLRALVQSRGQGVHVVYVDSGSTDDSVQMAHSLGVDVVALDMSIPFTAARARNAGFERLKSQVPDIEFVHFIDGDCELAPGWMDAAVAHLQAHPDHAVVCGRRRERYPNATIYNLLCDIEWDGPTGEVRACGGDALMRVRVFSQVGGFRPDLIAGEEPELCVRIRRQGYKIYRMDMDMCLHDADMTRFSQWWRRSVRAGHAFAEGAAIHGAPPELHFVRNVISAVAWGAGLPFVILVAGLVVGPPALLLFLLYPLQILRLTLKGPRSRFTNLVWATFIVLSRFSETVGAFKYVLRQVRRGPVQLIEYK